MAPALATLDFFAAQAAARRRTWLLILLFCLGFLGTVALADLGVAAALALAGGHVGLGLQAVTGHLPGPAGPWLSSLLLLLPPVALAVAVVVALGVAFHQLAQGRDGGDAVARMLGGRPVDRLTRDPGERRAVNVLEEMALAAGLPVPRLYLLDGEGSINAFAAGPSPERAVVAVTRGALDLLERDELQGVLAHELSHVLNADARLNLRLMVLVGGLAALATVGRVLVRVPGSGSGRRGGGIAAVGLAGLALLLAGSLGALFGRLLQAAVSRQREFLADAAAVQFTRNPGGLAGALAKVGEVGSALASPHAPEASHLLFAEGATGFWAGILSTHPPVAERLRRLRACAAAAPRASAHTPALPQAAATSPAGPGLAALAAVGRPGPGHLAAAAADLASFPPALAAAAREPYGARLLALAMLLDGDPGTRAGQLALLAAGATTSAELDRLRAALDQVPRGRRLALLDLALPALDALSAPQARELSRDLATAAGADGRITVFEWALQRLVHRRLAPRLGELPALARFRDLGHVQVELLELLSALAWAGTRDPALAQHALEAGTSALGLSARWRLLPRERLAPGRLDAVLAQLDQAAPPLKARILAAAAACALSDRLVTTPEEELLRAVAASLGLPMPALAPEGAPAASAA
jgi:Zn-dependent protease with chaperone function